MGTVDQDYATSGYVEQVVDPLKAELRKAKNELYRLKWTIYNYNEHDGVMAFDLLSDKIKEEIENEEL